MSDRLLAATVTLAFFILLATWVPLLDRVARLVAFVRRYRSLAGFQLEVSLPLAQHHVHRQAE